MNFKRNYRDAGGKGVVQHEAQRSNEARANARKELRPIPLFSLLPSAEKGEGKVNYMESEASL